MSKSEDGCGCWIFLIFIGFQIWAAYLIGVDIVYYLINKEVNQETNDAKL